MNKEKIAELKRFSESLALEAASLIKREMKSDRQVDFKGRRDMVTQVDRASEALITRRISEFYPGHTILAEESGGAQVLGDGYTWIIDPLDGTTNFVHGFPVFGVSIAVLKGQGILAAAIADPTRDELFSAGLGLGASLNESPIQVSSTAELSHSLLATGFPYENDTNFDINMRFWTEIYGKTQGLRRAGAAAIDLAWTACGRLDGFWELGLKPWDLAAGVLLVREAGGLISDPEGADLDIFTGDLLATNALLHDEMLAEMKAIRSR